MWVYECFHGYFSLFNTHIGRNACKGIKQGLFPKVYSNAHWTHSHKKRKDSLETLAEPAVLCVNVENQAILEPIPLYCASKCKQT